MLVLGSAARFLTGLRQILVHGPRVGDPCSAGRSLSECEAAKRILVTNIQFDQHSAHPGQGPPTRRKGLQLNFNCP